MAGGFFICCAPFLDITKFHAKFTVIFYVTGRVVVMIRQEIIAKVEELVAAPSVCAPIKSAAEAYLKAQDKNTAEALVKALEADVCTFDELIGLCESENGKKFFGAEKAAGMAEAAKKSKSEGGKYCLCPACQAGGVIYENKEALA
jgi:hypothetical protein